GEEVGHVKGPERSFDRQVGKLDKLPSDVSMLALLGDDGPRASVGGGGRPGAVGKDRQRLHLPLAFQRRRVVLHEALIPGGPHVHGEVSRLHGAVIGRVEGREHRDLVHVQHVIKQLHHFPAKGVVRGHISFTVKKAVSSRSDDPPIVPSLVVDREGFHAGGGELFPVFDKLFPRAAGPCETSVFVKIPAVKHQDGIELVADRKSTRLNSSHVKISYAVFCLKKKK